MKPDEFNDRLFEASKTISDLLSASNKDGLVGKLCSRLDPINGMYFSNDAITILKCLVNNANILLDCIETQQPDKPVKQVNRKPTAERQRLYNEMQVCLRELADMLMSYEFGEDFDTRLMQKEQEYMSLRNKIRSPVRMLKLYISSRTD